MQDWKAKLRALLPDDPHPIDATDPLGRRIYCTKHRWETHVLSQRPAIAQHLDAIHETLADPAEITKDRNYPDRRCYYRQLRLGMLVKVVVEPVNKRDSRVVTVYLLEKRPTQEEVLWSR